MRLTLYVASAFALALVACGDSATDPTLGADGAIDDAALVDASPTVDAADAAPADSGTEPSSWSPLLPSSFDRLKGTGCDLNTATIRALAVDPKNANHFAIVQDCKKPSWIGELVYDVVVGGDTAVHELLVQRYVGLTINASGRTIVASATPLASMQPTITLTYHDVGAPTWPSSSRSYTASEGTVTSLVRRDDLVLLVGHGVFDVSDVGTSSLWTRRETDIPTNIASGLDYAWLAIDPADPAKVVVATEFPLATWACALPSSGPGKLTCSAHPADQGLAAGYQAWTQSWVHAGTLATIWTRGQGSTDIRASTDRGATFSTLVLPPPCGVAGSTKAFAGDPHRPARFVIAQTATKVDALFATDDAGGSFRTIASAGTGSGKNVVAMAIANDAALVVAFADGTVQRTKL